MDKCWICGSDTSTNDKSCPNCGIDLFLPRKNLLTRNSSLDRQTSLGIFLVVVGAIVGIVSSLMGIVPMLAFGLGSLLIGLMVLYLPESSSIASGVVAGSILPSLLNIEKLLDDLDLNEKGIYIPTSGIGVSPKVFIPIARTPATEKPPLTMSNIARIFVTVGENPEDRGVLLDSPGSQIISVLERTLHLDFAQVRPEELQSNLSWGLATLGLAKTTTLMREGDIAVEVELIALFDLEKKLREMAPRVVTQIGTPVASAVAAAISKATRKYVTLKDAILDPSGKRMKIELKLS